MKPRIILATVGSLGDLHPFIALGGALRTRGADVVLACADDYRNKVEAAGLAFRSVRPNFGALQSDLNMNLRQLTQAVLARRDFLMREVVMPYLSESYDDMLATVQGADLIVTSSLAFSARLAAEQCAIPWIGAVLQPLMFLSAFDPPEIPGAYGLSRLLRSLGPRPTRWALRLMQAAVAPQLKPVHALRKRIGLAPSRLNPMFDGQFSTYGAIGMYGNVLGDVQPDYPRPTAITGFALYDGDAGGAESLEPGLREFLDAGPPPLAFTLGSLIVNSPGSFYRESVAAARRLGKRAVLLAGDNASATGVTGGAPDIYLGGYAPHSLLFPRTEAIVHQGGVGTLAQALMAGRPQLIVPFYADQADNSARAIKLGVARSLAPRRYAAASAARELRQLTSRPDYLSSAAHIRALLAMEDGAARAAEIILCRLGSHP